MIIILFRIPIIITKAIILLFIMMLFATHFLLFQQFLIKIYKLHSYTFIELRIKRSSFFFDEPTLPSRPKSLTDNLSISIYEVRI